MSAAPTIREVRFEDLPIGARGDRRACLTLSDGTHDQLVYFSDEVLFCEGDLIGKTVPQVRRLHFDRDREWLTS